MLKPGHGGAWTSDADRDLLAVELRQVPRDPDGRVAVERMVDALRPRHRPPILLESASGLPGEQRWSYLVTGTAGHLVHERSTTVWTTPDGTRRELSDDPFDALDRVCEEHGLTPDAERDPELPAFTGGLVGAFAYDLGRAVERLPALAAADREQPLLDLWLADTVVAVDHQRGTALLLHRPSGAGRDPDGLVARHESALRHAGEPAPPSVARPGAATSSLPRDRYLAAVRAVLEHIAAGDVFQVNLSQRLSVHWETTAWELYRALRTTSPAPNGAVLPAGSGAVASVSPETFLRAAGRDVETRPIKGTRPRGDEPDTDRAMREELVASRKDHAENVMVVDMERNDLGRVCEPGSVTVPELCVVEGHPTVWHLVSTIRGRLPPDTGYGRLLRATFPCGSVTGTPKVRAMELIETYEPVRRGWYCGALGFVSPGALSLSVAIRTASLHRGGTVDYGAGGGVVADSDPEDEYTESLHKAAAFLRAAGADPPATDDGTPRG